MVSATTENPTPALISLEPRQVMLGKQKNDSDLKTVEMQLVEEKKEKKRKKKMKKEMGPLLLQSIARYLETIGFSETLSALRSEASLHKIGAEMVHSLDLEAVCRQYMDTSEYHEEANGKNLKELDIADQPKDVITQEDVQPVSKKKKKSNVSDANIEVKDNISNGARDELYIENDKEKNKAESKKSKSDIESSNCNILLEESHVKSKGKKKKNESVSDSVVEDAKQVASETSQGAAEKTDQECHLDEMSKKSKRKKVKDKLSDSALPEKVQHDSSETLQEVIKDKSKDVLLPDTVAETAPVEISLDEAKSKDKKKKKKKEEKEKEDSNLTDSRKEGFLVSEENVVADEKKGSKKRKRSTSEETDSRVDAEIAKGSAPSKIDGSKENKEKEHQLPNDVQECNGHLNLGKKRKSEISDDGSNKCLNKQHEEDNRKVGGLADVNPPDKSRKDAATPKTTKKGLNGSAEPKTVNSFQRVKIDQVKFADERLQDNSYWAKSGAEIGYGAKAQEVLGQVKGRNFRHEKTKKKRGSYRGGQIDLQSHSIKFNYSDGDDE